MPTFRVSQAELWHRVYLIEAKTAEEAKGIYNKYLETGKEPDSMFMFDPEYVDDIAGDVSWWHEDGSPIEHEHEYGPSLIPFERAETQRCLYCGILLGDK